MLGDDSRDHEVDAARNEPHRFLGQLLQHHRGMLLRIARHRMTAGLRSRMDTSDVVQQTMVEAWQSWPGFLGNSRGQLVNWLQALLRRVVYRESRRRKISVTSLRVSGVSGDSDQSSTEWAVVDNRTRRPEQVAETAEARRMLADALADLPVPQRQVIFLRHYHGLQFSEIAALTSRSAAAARMVYIRGIVRLRNILDETSLEQK